MVLEPPHKRCKSKLPLDLFSPTNEIFRNLLAILCILRMTSDLDKCYTRFLLNTLREGGLYLHSGSNTEQLDGNSDRTAARQDTAKWQARERALSSESNAINPETGIVRLRLVEAINSGVRAHKYIMTKEGSL